MTSKIPLGVGGALGATAQDALEEAGFVVAVTGGETGRYTVTIQEGSKVARLLGVTVTLIGTADAAFTALKATVFQVRNDAVATAGTFDIQGLDPADNSDAVIEDNLTMLVTVVVGLV